jgi:glycosyl transferase family 25
MQVLVLNRAADAGRLEFQAAQLARLGLPFRRIEAVTPETLDPPAHDPWWNGWERPLTLVERAVLLTHRRAWAAVADSGAPALILEDDACLAAATPGFLAAVEGLAGIDHITLEVRGRRKLLSREADSRAPMRRLWQDRTGAAAYVLWPSGAQKLLARSGARPGLADAVICAAYEMSSFQADPALAIQLDQCARYGRPSPLPGATTNPRPRSRLTGDSAAARARFRLRRVAAQLRMGLRRLASTGRAAVRREVALSDDWPR